MVDVASSLESVAGLILQNLVGAGGVTVFVRRPTYLIGEEGIKRSGPIRSDSLCSN